MSTKDELAEFDRIIAGNQPPPFRKPPEPSPRPLETVLVFVWRAILAIPALCILSIVAQSRPPAETALWMILAALVCIGGLLWSIRNELRSRREP